MNLCLFQIENYLKQYPSIISTSSILCTMVGIFIALWLAYKPDRDENKNIKNKAELIIKRNRDLYIKNGLMSDDAKLLLTNEYDDYETLKYLIKKGYVEKCGGWHYYTRKTFFDDLTSKKKEDIVIFNMNNACFNLRYKNKHNEHKKIIKL